MKLFRSISTETRIVMETMLKTLQFYNQCFSAQFYLGGKLLLCQIEASSLSFSLKAFIDFSTLQESLFY